MADPDARSKLQHKLSNDPLFCSLFTAAADSQEALKVIRLYGLDLSIEEIIHFRNEFPKQEGMDTSTLKYLRLDGGRPTGSYWSSQVGDPGAVDLGSCPDFSSGCCDFGDGCPD